MLDPMGQELDGRTQVVPFALPRHHDCLRSDFADRPAHLGLARAYVLQADTAQARAAYQDFLTIWKNADPDVPILIAAKAEYAKLQ